MHNFLYQISRYSHYVYCFNTFWSKGIDKFWSGGIRKFWPKKKIAKIHTHFWIITSFHKWFSFPKSPNTQLTYYQHTPKAFLLLLNRSYYLPTLSVKIGSVSLIFWQTPIPLSCRMPWLFNKQCFFYEYLHIKFTVIFYNASY